MAETRDLFIAKLTRLAAADITDAVFAEAVYTAQAAYGLDAQKFRDAFGLTAGAVERWMQGNNLPQPLIRPKIIAWIAAEIEQRPRR